MHSHFSANSVEKLKKVQWKTNKKGWDTGHMKNEIREKKRLSGTQIVACSCLKSGCKDVRAELFSVGADDNFNDKATFCKMATKRPFFTRRVIGITFPPAGMGIGYFKSVVEFLSLGFLSLSLDKTLDDLSCCW